MGAFLYNTIIYPLTQIIEFSFSFCVKLFDSTGIALMGVSFAVSMLTLPLYIVAEHWQQVERDIEKALKPEVEKIKSVFKGNEQYMVLSTYYRENHYHPIMSLRASFGLLIQIPFFTAAYTYLSHLSALKGQHFLFIRDMGSPDALFMIGSFAVNILPIAMTLVNFISGAIYTKGLSLRDKLQVYGLALIFVCILYNSPAGLVLYWTMNNIFSLIKNIFYKMKHPLTVLYALMSSAAAVLTVWLFCSRATSPKNSALIGACLSVIYFIPLIIKFFRYLIDNPLSVLRDNAITRFALFITSAAGLWLLAGLFIPTQLIASSPVEFSGIDSYSNPLFFVSNTMIQSFGLFIVWPLLIYLLYHERIQTIFSSLSSVMLLGAIINAFLFQGKYGILSRLLIFTQVSDLSSSIKMYAFNILCLLIPVILIISLAYFKQKKILFACSLIAVVSLAGISFTNMSKINGGYKKYERLTASNEQKKNIEPIFHFSKTGKNVLLIYLDRAENRFVEPIFDESPELYNDYSGFILYKNTVSFNGHTLLGAPPVYGGYEYTPEAMNSRNNETLVEKQNQALLLLPRIFTEQSDFTATCTDPTWANYDWIPDLSIFKPYPKIQGETTDGVYLDTWYKEHKETADFKVSSKTLKRNMIWYSILRECPLILQRAIYNQGSYWCADKTSNDYNDFLNGYSVLDYLPRLTAFDGTSNNYMNLTNNTTHDNLKQLQSPEYRPVSSVNSSWNPSYATIISYGTNAASLHRIGEWFSMLQKEGVYNNTRIVIVADHGCSPNEDGYIWDNKFDTIDPGHYHPLLLFKDFNAQGTLSINNDFMTNGDVPTLLLQGIISHPKNPYTGKEITNESKKNGALICTCDIYMPYQNKSKYVFTPSDDEWWRVSGNIFKSENWKHESPDKNMEENK
jgi:YidC/Oxa1 family membrane protein insertase